MRLNVPPLWLLPFNACRFWLEQHLPKRGESVPPTLWDLNPLVADWSHPDTAVWQARERVLSERYPLLETLIPAMPQTWVRLESLQHLHWLDAHVTPWVQAVATRWLQQQPWRGLDIGSKQWAYAPAQLAWLHTLQAWGAELNETTQGSGFPRADFYGAEFHGMELDAYRRYAGGWSRWNYAQGVVALAPDRLHYHVGNVLTHHPPHRYQVIVHSLPFVVPDPHLHWGLPWHTYQPLAVLCHVIEHLLAENGLLFIMNLTPAEAHAQERLFQEAQAQLGERLSWQQHRIHDMGDSFIASTHRRVGWVLQRCEPTSVAAQNRTATEQKVDSQVS
ncbi:MAG: hypothetical protein ACKO34_05790 [Vampirovibrionales bacterium]